MKTTRTRMLDAAVEAIRRDGVDGMSFTDVLEASGAARGAIYHHFPGGKSQLVCEAVEGYARDIEGHLAALEGETPAEVVAAFFSTVRPLVADSAAGRGCALAAGTLAASHAEGLAPVLRDAFARWTDTLAARLGRAGAGDGARGAAVTLLALLEGAHILCRAAADMAPFDSLVTSAGGIAASIAPPELADAPRRT
ncbi:MAG: TetR/AcrR family transcriptional regulator [Rhodoglobus sp.]